MNIHYKKSNRPTEIEQLIDQLIDDHSRQEFDEQDDLQIYQYAICAELLGEDIEPTEQAQGKFIGGVAFRQLLDTAHIGALAVASEYRGHDIGSRLIEEAELFLEKQGVHTVTLSTLNYQALGFYQKLGYQVYGQLEDLPRKGVTKYHLYKRLSPYEQEEEDELNESMDY